MERTEPPTSKPKSFDRRLGRGQYNTLTRTTYNLPHPRSKKTNGIQRTQLACIASAFVLAEYSINIHIINTNLSKTGHGTWRSHLSKLSLQLMY